ncbi:MAG: hypothetical protein HY707_07615 [Ignavibacteriae bacterium]|nr:hypothetical protein [Ignavibacteriota bacterium]
MLKISGPTLILIGVIHTLFGLIGGYSTWKEMAQIGFIDSVGSRIPHSSMIFWFTFVGPMTILIGHLCVRIEGILQRPLPLFIGIELFILSTIGVVLDGPDSGFWLVLATAVNMIVAGKRAQNASIASVQ